MDILFSIEIGVVIGILFFLVRRIFVIERDIRKIKNSLFFVDNLIMDDDMEEDLKNRDRGILVRSTGKRKEMER